MHIQQLRFDVLPLLVATGGAMAGGPEPGEVVIGIQDIRGRRIMTTFDPDTQAQEVEVLRRIRREFAWLLTLNCCVIKPGKLAVGEAVKLATST